LGRIMRLAIVSDIHANLEALQATLQQISAQQVDRIVCLGDVVGYNTNPAECIALLRGCNPLWVAGNHDRAVTGQITTAGFSHTATRAIAWTRKRLGADHLAFLAGLPLKANLEAHLIAVHGALHPDTGCEVVRLDNNERRRLSFDALIANPSGARVCAFGHTHQLGIFELVNGVVRAQTSDEVKLREDAFYLVNPGTVGQPLTADRRASYLVMDTARQVISVQRAEYDFSIPRAKSRRAGLLPRSSFVPIPVRAPLKRAARALGLYATLKKAGW
jgi:predicted phosphodiesterase